MENAFGLLVARWRLLKTEINAKPEHVELYTKACCVLHNYLQSAENVNFQVEVDPETDSLPSVTLSQSSGRSSHDGIRIREQLKDYFMCENVLAWQYDHVMYDGHDPQDHQ